MHKNTTAISRVTPAMKECAWQYPHIGLIPIAALYLILGFYQIGHQSLWTDEVISLNRASSALSILSLLQSHNSAYYALLGLWMKAAGATEVALRALSTILGLVAVCMTYALAFRLFNRRVALFAGILFASSPYFIWYAQEARYVILMLVTALVSTYLFHRAICDVGWKWWAAYATTSILALLSFVTVIFLLFAHGLYVLCCACHRPMLQKWMACQLASFILFAMWYIVRPGLELKTVTTSPTVVSHEQSRSREVRPLSDVIGAIPYTLFAFSVGFSLGPSLRELHESRSLSTLLSHASTLIPVGALFASLFVMGLVKLWQNSSSGIFVIMWLSVPIIGTFMVANMTAYHMYNTRYVAMALPAYALILATGIAGFARPSTALALLTCVLSVNGVSLSNYYFVPGFGREDARSAAEYLESAGQPGDIVMSVGSSTALRYYYKGDAPFASVNARNTEADVVNDVQNLVRHYNRLWLVALRPWETDPKGRVKATLDSLARPSARKTFSGVEVYFYQLPDRRSFN